jgi:hypothetical protein
MSPLEKLFLLELDFHRRVRTQAIGTAEAASLHTSYALQSGYEQLIRQLGPVAASAIEAIRRRHTLTADTRDLLAARDTLKTLLGVSQLDN